MLSTHKRSVISDDHIYYNVLIPNNPVGNTFTSIPAEFKEEMTIPIVKYPSEYYMSIIRFSVPLNSIPLFIFNIQSGQTQTDPNLGRYSVTLDDGATTNQQFLNYFPTQLYTAVPQPPSARPPSYLQEDSQYYAVYDIPHMLTMINNAFAAALAAFPVVPGRDPPKLIYDSATRLISLYAQQAFYDSTVPGNIKIFGNVPLLRFISGLSISVFGTGNLPFGKNFYFNCYDLGNNVSSGIIKMTQDFPGLSNWNDVTSIVFTSGRIPVRNESVPSEGTEANFGRINSEGAPNFRPILTDFEPFMDDGINPRTYLQYAPQGPYRFVNLLSDTPLRNFDVTVWWQDRNNNLRKVFIGAFQHVSIKLLFVKKSVYNSQKTETGI